MDRPAGEEAEALRLVPEAVTPVSSREVPPHSKLAKTATWFKDWGVCCAAVGFDRVVLGWWRV